MKIKLYNKVRFLSDLISIDRYIKLTKQSKILPFYHSVTNNPKSHLKHLNYYRTEERFKEDLNFYLANYKSISLAEIKNTNDRVFHVNFDDGLSEVYENVIPLLLSNNIHGTFFINSDFIDNRKMFYKHRISLIIDVIKQSKHNEELAKSFFSCDDDKLYQFIHGLTDEAKIENLENTLKIDVQQYLSDNQPYLTRKQLLEMIKMGFVIGNHSKSHPNFRDISFEEQKKQIVAVNQFLKNELNIKDFYFSFPFGDENIKNEFFDFMYNEENIIYSFGVSGIKNDEYTRHLHRIPMEIENFSAEQIIKFEYFYYIIKSFFNKNTIKRNRKA